MFGQFLVSLEYWVKHVMFPYKVCYSLSDLHRAADVRLATPTKKGAPPTRWAISPVINAVYNLGGGFKYFLFLPLPGEMIQFD